MQAPGPRRSNRREGRVHRPGLVSRGTRGAAHFSGRFLCRVSGATRRDRPLAERSAHDRRCRTAAGLHRAGAPGAVRKLCPDAETDRPAACIVLRDAQGGSRLAGDPGGNHRCNAAPVRLALDPSQPDLPLALLPDHDPLQRPRQLTALAHLARSLSTAELAAGERLEQQRGLRWMAKRDDPGRVHAPQQILICRGLRQSRAAPAPESVRCFSKPRATRQPALPAGRQAAASVDRVKAAASRGRQRTCRGLRASRSRSRARSPRATRGWRSRS